MDALIVLDASVAAKWLFLQEDFSKEAGSLYEKLAKNEIKAIVPEFFYLELANVCVRKVRKKLVKLEVAGEFLQKVAAISMEEYSDRELRNAALDNAFIYNISVYDAVYISLAEIYPAPVVTADEELLKACKGRFPFIEHLKDFKI